VTTFQRTNRTLSGLAAGSRGEHHSVVAMLYARCAVARMVFNCIAFIPGSPCSPQLACCAGMATGCWIASHERSAVVRIELLHACQKSAPKFRHAAVDQRLAAFDHQRRATIPVRCFHWRTRGEIALPCPKFPVDGPETASPGFQNAPVISDRRGESKSSISPQRRACRRVASELLVCEVELLPVPPPAGGCPAPNKRCSRLIF